MLNYCTGSLGNGFSVAMETHQGFLWLSLISCSFFSNLQFDVLLLVRSSIKLKVQKGMRYARTRSLLCRRNKCPGLSFHDFLKDDQLRRRWIAAIKRNKSRFSFAIRSDTCVCSAHFTAKDYFAQCGPEVLSEGQGRRRPCLKRDAVPSIFSFRPAVTTRPSPSKRRQDALERYEKVASQAKLPKFGPLTELETLRLELKEARERIVSLEHASSALLGENKLLKSQVFRYVNVKEDSVQLMYLTDLTIEIWDALWEFLDPSPENVLSAKSAATEEEGRLNRRRKKTPAQPG